MADMDYTWLLKFDPFTIERERFNTTRNLRNEIPGCTHDREMQEFYREASTLAYRRQQQALLENDYDVNRYMRARQQAERATRLVREREERDLQRRKDEAVEERGRILAHQLWVEGMQAKGHRVTGGPYSFETKGK